MDSGVQMGGSSSPENRKPPRRLARAIGWLLGVGLLLLAVLFPLQPVLKERDVARALEGVTLLRVRSGGACHRRLAEERTIFETRDPAEIHELAGSIRFAGHVYELGCQCCGRPSLEFYRGDVLALAFSLHHGESIRLIDGPWENAPLTTASGKGLTAWLDRHGVTEEKVRGER